MARTITLLGSGRNLHYSKMTVVYYPGKGMQGKWLAKSKDACVS